MRSAKPYKPTDGAARAESCSHELCRVVTEVDHRSNVLKSKVLISNVSNNSRRGATKAFTERGLYMLATVLKGERARQVTFTIIETFFKVRELKRELLDLHKETDKQKQQSKMQHFGEVLTDIVMPDLQTSETESSLDCPKRSEGKPLLVRTAT